MQPHTLTRLISVATIAIWLSAQVANAQPSERRSSGSKPASEPFTLTLQEVNNAPQREVEFAEISEERALQLPRPDPELLEKKFVASLSFTLPPNSAFVMNEQVLNRLQTLNGTYLIFPHVGGGNIRKESDALGATLNRILEALPEDRRPPKENVEFLAREPSDIERFTTSAVDELTGKQTHNLHFRIYTDSAEAARRYAAGLLTLLDQGVTRAYQIRFFEQRQEQLELAKMAKEAIDKESAEGERLKKEAAEVADFPGELLPTLRAQQLQLEVDLAGTKSRIAACHQLLEKGELSAERRGHVLDLKVTAEIDLASFEARQKTTEHFISQAKRWTALQGELAEVANRKQASQRKLQTSQDRVRQLESQILAYQPLQLDGKINIQPLKWVK
jgi:hypothetical protein